MSQNTTINGTNSNVISVIGTVVNGSVVSRRDVMLDKMRLDHGKPLCQASQPKLAAALFHEAAEQAECWQQPRPESSWPRPAYAGVDMPAAAWASLVLSPRAISV